jgi:hypothetical protein
MDLMEKTGDMVIKYKKVKKENVELQEQVKDLVSDDINEKIIMDLRKELEQVKEKLNEYQ